MTTDIGYNTTGLYSNLNEAPYDMPRDQLPQLIPSMIFPTTYVENTEKEELVLKMVDRFQAQYSLLFSNSRKPLLLSPLNECSCHKFISSFIRPTQLKYDELYDAHLLARFISGYIRYKKLEFPDVLPNRVMSPTTVMTWQVGNSIEMALLLASLLIGDGYNAYVVVGYATEIVCNNDTSVSPWPDYLPEEINPDDVVLSREPPKSKYMEYLSERPKLISQFDIKRKQREQEEFGVGGNGSYGGGLYESNNVNRSKMQFFQNGASSNDNKDKPFLKSNLIHAWVIVLPNKRQVEIPTDSIRKRLNLEGSMVFKGIPSTTILHESELGKQPDNSHQRITEPLIFEPASAVITLVKDSGDKYLGVESIFNHHNYYVNLHPEVTVPQLKMDLQDLSQWESIFLKDPTMASMKEENTSIQDKRKAVLEATADIGANGDQTFDLPVSWVGLITLNPQQYANKYPGLQKTLQYSDTTIDMYAEYTQPDLRVLIVSLPDPHSQINQTHVFYKHRQDKLRRYTAFPQERTKLPRLIHQWFDPGRLHENSHRVEGLRELILEPGKQRTMRFYWKSRDDGLVLRREIFYSDRIATPKKIQEEYKEREDYLTYRSSTFEISEEEMGATGAGAERGIGGAGRVVSLFASNAILGQSLDKFKVEPIKMSERFARNPNIDADKDVMKCTYIKPGSSEGEIWVQYHYHEDKITNVIKLFPKSYDRSKDTNATNVMPSFTNTAAADAADSGIPDASTFLGEKPPQLMLLTGMKYPKNTDLLNELRVHMLKEAECLNEIRNNVNEVKKILPRLDCDMKENVSVISIYDTLRGKPKETGEELAARMDEERRKMESRKDYLAPFIARQDNMVKLCKGDYTNVRLTAEMARKVRDEAITDLKERLIERGHIMQTRLDKEREDLMRKQMALQKSIDTTEGNTKDAEDFAKYSKEATWRIRILEERLSNYIKASAEKYSQLATKLANDMRLTVLYTGMQ